jgi:hypothetical protein
MNITLFGATGATGKLLTERCLKAGHKVKILARNAATFPFAAQVEAVKGDAKDITVVREALRGADVVLSALGARSLKREDILEDAVPLIVQAMWEQGIRRIIALRARQAAGLPPLDRPAHRLQHLSETPRRIATRPVRRTLRQRPRLDHGDAADAPQRPRPRRPPHRRRRPTP